MVLLFPFIISQISESDSLFFRLDTVYTRYEAVESDTMLKESLFIRVQPDTERILDENLRISGTKDFSFDIDQGFNQGLDVDISGRVEDIHIEGSLSDQATAQSTIQLSEVDKMNLTIYTKHFYGGLGNLTLELPFGIRDEIQGARVGIRHTDDTHLYSTYAVERGQFYRMQFTGEEGKQSPYILEGQIIPGTERVFLSQGSSPAEMLLRDVDYTIDYEAAILSFTNNTIITKYSRVEVEYERANNAYPIIYAEADGNLKLSTSDLRGLFLRTYDDQSNPYTFTLNESERQLLAAAGDSTTVLHTYADTSSEGDYIFQDSHFVYVGDGSGTHTVTFYYVGEGNGEYVYDPVLNGFSYQGANSGNYSPTTYLPLPGRSEFFGLGFNAFESIDIELYGSNDDKNTLSSLDDDDNVGAGFHGKFDRSYNKFSLYADYTYYHEHLNMPRGKEMVDYAYQWNTHETLEETANIGARVTPVNMLTLSGGYGILNRSHKRRYITLQPFFFTFGYESVDSISRYYAGCMKKTSSLDIKTRYEYSQNTHLFNYSTSYRVSKKSTVGLKGSYDRDTLRTGITTTGSLDLPGLVFSLGHRTYGDTSFLFGNAQLNVHIQNFSCVGELQHTQRYSQKRDEKYVAVEEGTGNYVYDPVTGQYIEVEGGDYIKKIFLLPEFERTNARAYSLETRYSHSLTDVSGRFSLVDEEEFYSISGDASVLIGIGQYNLNMTVGQNTTDDNRYALQTSTIQDLYYSLGLTRTRLASRADIKEYTEKYNELIREQRNSYAAQISYDIVTRPLVRPMIKYSHTELLSSYLAENVIYMYKPQVSLLIGIPFKNQGRIECSGELIYRIYSIDDVPYLFAARDPAGLTKTFTSTIRFGMSAHTVINLVYRITFPPDQEYRHNLRFLTQIRF
jgi:hypothetical protein